MLRTLLITFVLSITGSLSHAASVTTVPSVDLARYLGKWYEIARYPNRFQDDCVRNTSAEYSLKPNGKIKVVNRCIEADGSENKATGRAYVVEGTQNAQLRVSFFWPFYGDYWIIDLDKDYQYAVVGTPNREYLWILSRTPKLPQPLLQQAQKNILQQGFDLNKLIYTPQQQ